MVRWVEIWHPQNPENRKYDSRFMEETWTHENRSIRNIYCTNPNDKHPRNTLKSKKERPPLKWIWFLLSPYKRPLLLSSGSHSTILKHLGKARFSSVLECFLDFLRRDFWSICCACIILHWCKLIQLFLSHICCVQVVEFLFAPSLCFAFQSC